ncbi:MAG: translation initiation factor [Chitinophagaceae bacterium]
MAKSKQNSPFVYSTNPDFHPKAEEDSQETLPKEKQRLRVSLDKKQRAGKVVTLIENFIGTEDDLQALAKLLKTKCGTGGSAKDGLILIQGDYKDKVQAWLKDWGYGGR